MPLLCISLLALLFLPPSLSCNSSKANVLRENFRAVGKTLLDNAKKDINASLSDFSCLSLKKKLPGCTANPNEANSVNTLLILACKIQNLDLPQTNLLAKTIQGSIDCPCPTKSPDRQHITNQGKKKRTRRMSGRKMNRKRCRAMAILQNMTQCYEILNSLSMDT
ncbi:uncharacterized protein LOC105356670 isoform X1 [Oryzias latipes]|uniref:Interleukin-7 n=1 Tax=Oryzias latipes TaxID=8090 RepID=A0A3B3I799_ORYLA|nr:uncharacterized protein LOC105356670 isoform X1 [Oryzias latipes]QXY08307.1 interleukin-7 [Oryzias latipes]